MLNKKFSLIVAGILILFAAQFSFSQETEEPTKILFTNVNVWDGTGEKVISADVLVENNLIKQVKSGITAGNSFWQILLISKRW
ncbi:MAG: hypothetical protein ACE1ZQ_06680 [Ignavibacteriaceae bacterium]